MQNLDHQGLPVLFLLRDGGTLVIILRDIAYAIGTLVTVTVPRGFESDGCSLPRFFWRVIGHPFSMQYLKEAILHDWLYRHQPCNRLLADGIFRSVLVGRVGPIRRWAIYWGLRLGGWVAWNRNRKRLAELPVRAVEPDAAFGMKQP